MNKRKKLGICVVSFVLAFLMFAVLLVLQKSMNEEMVYEEVLCVKGQLLKNTLLTQENIGQYLEIRRMPAECLPKEYIGGEAGFEDMVAKTDLTEGTIVSKAMFTPYRECYSAYQNLTWISVPIGALYEGVAGTLREGDYIDVYVMHEKEEEKSCSLLAEKVRIEGAYTEQGGQIDESSRDGLCQMIVIPMERDEVALFYEILAQGNIRIAKYENI